MGFYLENKDKKDCFNCSACKFACPKKAIKMQYNEEDGYYYPKIDKKKCIHCGKCRRVCINLNRDHLVQKVQNAYVIYNKNIRVRKKSSSGGISSLLMDYVIRKNGVVYGVCYDDQLKVIHKRATTKEECEAFKTSKYVKSDIGNTYQQVLNDLKENQLVLFTGTPCQVAGLKSFIPKKLQQFLILCEVMCDCVASPLFFKKFKEYLENTYHSQITNMNFRSKENGSHQKSMKVNFSNKEEVIFPISEENPYAHYMQVFGCGLSSPYCCLNCEFEHIDERVSDFTIGDYWGKKEVLLDDHLGISILLINSNKAKIIFDKYLSERVEKQQVKIKEALSNNHQEHKQIVLNKEKFMKELKESDFETLIKKYVTKYKWRTKIGRIIPPKLKEELKRIIKH